MTTKQCKVERGKVHKYMGTFEGKIYCEDTKKDAACQNKHGVTWLYDYETKRCTNYG